MTKILVTGSSGFIGSYVINNLINRGITPIAFDRLSRLEPFSNKVQLFLGDVRDSTSVLEAVSICDGVIHLAGILGTSETIENPFPSIETNIIGGLNVFQAAKFYAKKVCYISVGNYWMNNSYSISKDTVERFAWMFNREFGTKIAIVRALNAYGPGQKIRPIRKIIPNFIVPAIKNEELVVYGDGTQVMDMIYVKDLADILVRALLEEHGQYLYNPTELSSPPKFEAGTGVHTTVKDIAELIIKLVGKGSIRYAPMRGGEPEKSIVIGNPETLRPLFNGEIPKLTNLVDGLIQTIKYYSEVNNA